MRNQLTNRKRRMENEVRYQAPDAPRVFKTRSEKMAWIAQQKGWGPLTEEDKKELDEAVRMVTNLD